MNKTFVPPLIRRFGRDVVLPAVPRVRSGFKTLYVQCASGALAQRVRQLADWQMSPANQPMNVPGKRASARVMRSSRALARQWIELENFLRRIAFAAGEICGTAHGLLVQPHPAILLATNASLTEAILMEPLLSALAGREGEMLCLWAIPEVCEFYSATPYVGQLRMIRRSDDVPQSFAGELIERFVTVAALCGRPFNTVICDPRNNLILADAVERAARTQSVCLLERAGAEREHVLPDGRVIHYVPVNGHDGDLLEEFSGLAAQFRCSAAGRRPRIYPADRALQFAHSRMRDWRGSAQSLGALSIVGVIPCAQPADLTIGLGLWASAVRELWLRHHALAVLLAEGADTAAIEQLSTLLGETPHIRVSGPMDVLERAAVLARVDAVIAAAGSSAQLALAQQTPTVIAGSDYRRRFFQWAGSRLCYVPADGTGRLDASDLIRAYQRAVAPATRIRVAG